jgi:hypothetical protein
MLTATLVLVLLSTPGSQGADAPILLDFHSQNCGPCRDMRPAIDELISKNYPVKSVDTASFPNYVARYHIEHVPTFVVVDADGQELGRLEGARPASELAQMYLVAKRQVAKASATTRPSQPVSELRDDEPGERDPAAKPKPWETVVRIRIPDGPYVGFGSGTIIYSSPEESVILTCAHIFKLKGRPPVPPSKFTAKLHVDLFDGKLRGLKPAVVHATETFLGEAVDYDFAADVGLIRIRPGRRLPSSPVVPQTWKPTRGLEMVTVGCSQGRDATAWSTQISRPDARFEAGGKPYSSIECVHAPLEGRSGGGLYTTDGYVAGVCDFADKGSDRGLYASPRSIYKLLDRNKLTLCYAPDARTTRPGASTALASNRSELRGSSEPPKYRSQGPAEDPITLPPPEMLGAKLPSSSAGEAGNPGSRMTWQASGKGRPDTTRANLSKNRVSVAQQEPRPQSKARLQSSTTDGDARVDPDFDGPGRNAAGPERAEMRLASPTADPFEDLVSESSNSTKSVGSKTSGMWRAVRKPTSVATDMR